MAVEIISHIKHTSLNVRDAIRIYRYFSHLQTTLCIRTPLWGRLSADDCYRTFKEHYRVFLVDTRAGTLPNCRTSLSGYQVPRDPPASRLSRKLLTNLRRRARRRLKNSVRRAGVGQDGCPVRYRCTNLLVTTLENIQKLSIKIQ